MRDVMLTVTVFLPSAIRVSSLLHFIRHSRETWPCPGIAVLKWHPCYTNVVLIHVIRLHVRHRLLRRMHYCHFPASFLLVRRGVYVSRPDALRPHVHPFGLCHFYIRQ